MKSKIKFKKLGGRNVTEFSFMLASGASPVAFPVWEKGGTTLCVVDEGMDISPLRELGEPPLPKGRKARVYLPRFGEGGPRFAWWMRYSEQEGFFASAEARFFCVDKRTQKPQGSSLDPTTVKRNYYQRYLNFQ